MHSDCGFPNGPECKRRIVCCKLAFTPPNSCSKDEISRTLHDGARIYIRVKNVCTHSNEEVVIQHTVIHDCALHFTSASDLHAVVQSHGRRPPLSAPHPRCTHHTANRLFSINCPNTACQHPKCNDSCHQVLAIIPTGDCPCLCAKCAASQIQVPLVYITPHTPADWDHPACTLHACMA